MEPLDSITIEDSQDDFFNASTKKTTDYQDEEEFNRKNLKELKLKIKKKENANENALAIEKNFEHNFFACKQSSYLFPSVNSNTFIKITLDQSNFAHKENLKGNIL